MSRKDQRASLIFDRCVFNIVQERPGPGGPERPGPESPGSERTGSERPGSGGTEGECLRSLVDDIERRIKRNAEVRKKERMKKERMKKERMEGISL